ncbi:MAG: hypothetical protein ACI857_001779 [Arenicella sp.]|jgi:hypothetical protein
MPVYQEPNSYSNEDGRKYNKPDFYSHPDFGSLTFNAPLDKNVVEDISKRTEKGRYYTDINNPQYFYIEKSSKAINMEFEGYIRAIDASMHMVGQGKYASGLQYCPTSIDAVNQKTKMIYDNGFVEFNSYRLKIIHLDESIEIIEADWSNLEMTNFKGFSSEVFPGIDMNFEFAEGRIKSSFVIKQNLNVKKLVFIDDLNFSSEFSAFLSNENPFGSDFLEIYNTETSETEIVVQPAYSFDASSNRVSWISEYGYTNTELFIHVDSAHLNNPAMVYPITVDPTFIAVGPITNGGGVHGSVLSPGTCTDNIVLTFPGGSEPWDTQVSWTVYAQQCFGSLILLGATDQCWLSDAQVFITACGNFSPNGAPAIIWTCFGAACNGPGFWTPTIPFGGNGMVDLIDCYPAQCADQTMTFTINTARVYCAPYTFYDNCTWANSYCVSLDDWSVTVQGRSIETLNNTGTGNGTQNIYDADCAGTQTLDPTPLYGVSPYTYLWSTGATSPTISVPGTVSTFTADVTDLCGNTVTATFDIGCPLASELIDFNVVAKDRRAILSWITLSEVENELFIIEKSTDGINWRVLSEIEGATNSDQKLSYEYTDIEPFSGMNYYRVKYESTQGKYKFSTTKSVRFDYHYSIYPNPAKNKITIASNDQSSEKGSYQIINVLGEEVLRGEFNTSLKLVDIESLENGVYLLKLSQQGKVIESSRFVKQN